VARFLALSVSTSPAVLWRGAQENMLLALRDQLDQQEQLVLHARHAQPVRRGPHVLPAQFDRWEDGLISRSWHGCHNRGSPTTTCSLQNDPRVARPILKLRSSVV